MRVSRRGLLAVLTARTVFARKSIRSAQVETVFDSPGPKPNGLQATDEGLWILDQGNGRVYLVDYGKGKTLRVLNTDTEAGSGITFDGRALWTASTYSREILRVDAHSGRTLERYPSPDAGVVGWTTSRRSPLAPASPPEATPRSPSRRSVTGAHGLEWRRGKLWMSNPPSRMIYRIDPATFRVEQQFPTAGDRPHGLGWEGGWLWCAESNENAFFRFDPDAGTWDSKIQLMDSDPLPHGMTIRDGWLWYCDDVGVVCRLRLAG